MKKADLVSLLQTEAERVTKELKKLNPGTKEYEMALNSLRNLARAAQDYAKLEDGYSPEPESSVSGPDESTAAPAPEPETPKAAPENTDVPALSLVEVRTKLAQAAQGGVNVAEIIQSCGYTNLSKIPAELYPTLLEKAGVA